MCVYIYVYIYICIYVYIYMYIYIYVYIYMYTYIYIYRLLLHDIHVCIRVYIYIALPCYHHYYFYYNSHENKWINQTSTYYYIQKNCMLSLPKYQHSNDFGRFTSPLQPCSWHPHRARAHRAGGCRWGWCHCGGRGGRARVCAEGFGEDLFLGDGDVFFGGFIGDDHGIWLWRILDFIERDEAKHEFTPLVNSGLPGKVWNIAIV